MMKAVNRNFLLKFPALLAFVLITVLASSQTLALGVTSQRSKSSSKARTAKSSVKTTKASGKKLSSKSAKKTVVARSSKNKGGKSVTRASAKRGKAYNARRSTKSRSKSRSRVARYTPSYKSSPIQKFLTESWNQPASGVVRTSPGRSSSATDGVLAVPQEQRNDEENDENLDPDVVEKPLTSPTDELAKPVLPENPLVAAFAESLLARRFNYENQGFILETEDGEVLGEYNADRKFNPASVTKVATSLAVISKLGHDFRFRTSIYTDGVLDQETGTLRGSIYVIGSGDLAFVSENVLLLADRLNSSGIRTVEGNLYVLGQFHCNFNRTREASARSFRTIITTDKWTAATQSAYSRMLAMKAAASRLSHSAGNPFPIRPDEPPHLTILGETISEAIVDTTNLKPLAIHTSLPLIRVLKALNDFSNNWMAETVSQFIGGPSAVDRFLKTEVGLKEEEARIVTGSGLGDNALSPRATVQILKKLNHYLMQHDLSLEHILPVAGIDAGTLQRRFTDVYRGSLIAKTGTLSGVSALAGVIHTRTKGRLYFVIYNRGGSPASFRATQDETMKKIITLFGGPAPIAYPIYQ